MGGLYAPREALTVAKSFRYELAACGPDEEDGAGVTAFWRASDVAARIGAGISSVLVITVLTASYTSSRSWSAARSSRTPAGGSRSTVVWLLRLGRQARA